MTKDNDPDHFNPTLPRKSYNPFESDDETLDTSGMESETVYSKEDHIGFDLKEFEKCASPLTFLMDNDESLWEEDILDQTASANDQSSSFKKDGEMYDKNVTIYELPEPLISKDIGVDEGAHTHESRKGDNAVNVEKDGHELDVLGALKPKLKSDNNEDLHMDGLNRDVLRGKCMVDDPKLDYEDQASSPLVYDVADTVHAAEMDPSNASKMRELDSVDEDGHDDEDTLMKKANDNFPDKEETILIQEPATGETLSQLLTEQEQTTKIQPDESRNEEQTLTDSDSNIAFGFNSSTHSDPRKQEDNPQNSEATKPPSPQPTSRHEQPSSVTFTGPVSYAGSVSVRSESSTASTRSFAFPVLQNEWNSSPVRMAKADRRRSKAYRGWVQAFVCCRF